MSLPNEPALLSERREAANKAIASAIETCFHKGFPGVFLLATAAVPKESGVPAYVRDAYPEIIALDFTDTKFHQHHDVVVEEDRFHITVGFDDGLYRCEIPFTAVVQSGLYYPVVNIYPEDDVEEEQAASPPTLRLVE